MAVPRRVEIWDNFVSLGGVRKAVIRDRLSLIETQSTQRLWEVRCRYPRVSPAHAEMREWRVFRVDYSDSSFDEFRIVGVPVEDRDNHIVEITGYDPGVDFTRAIVGRTEADGSTVYDFEALSLTPSLQISSFILPAMTAAGLTQFTLGTVDPTLPLDMRYGYGQGDAGGWDSAWSALLRLAQVARDPATGMPCEIQRRRNGTSGYFLDLLYKVGASATAFDVRFGKNLPKGWSRSRSTDRHATQFFPRGTGTDGMAATIARAQWKVTAKSSNTLTLADPAGGDGPLAYDDQLNSDVGNPVYLRRKDGTLTLVTDSLLSTQQVVVADATGVSVNDIIEFRLTSAGNDLTFLENPTARALYGVVRKPLLRPDIPGTVNLGDNAVCRDYAGSSSPPDRWSKVKNPTTTKTTTANRWRAGGASCRVQSALDGEGVDTPYNPVIPTAKRPVGCGFFDFWVETGKVRVELIAAKDPISVTTVARSGTVVTVTTGAAHGLVVGNRVEILGAVETEYNGIWVVVTAPTTTTLTFTIATTPSTPATGTITAAWCRRIPEGTEGTAVSGFTTAWDRIGINDQTANFLTLGATRLKMRIVQDGTGTADFYVDAYQITMTSAQQPFVEGVGPTKLWQEANKALKVFSAPTPRYQGPFLNLQEVVPAVFTQAYHAPTLGGVVNVTDPELGTVSVRILELKRDRLKPAIGDMTLADDPGDLIDELTKVRRPPARPVDVTTFTLPRVDFSPIRPAGSPSVVQLRLSTSPGYADAIQYWIGDEGEEPPPPSLIQAGSPSVSTWGTYTTPISIGQDQVLDLRVWAYCRVGSRRSPASTYRIDKDSIPEILSMSAIESPSLNEIISWTVDDDVRRVRLWRKVGSWPTSTLSVTSITRASSTATATTASPHNLKTGDIVTISGASQSEYNGDFVVTVLSSTTFSYTVGGSPATPATGTILERSGRNPIDTAGGTYLVELGVTADMGGIKANGDYVPGATTLTETVGANGDKVYYVAIPVDWRDNAGPYTSRGCAKVTLAAAASPIITSMVATRTNDGSACDTTNGVQYTFTWTSSGLTDGTHKVRIMAEAAAEEFSTTDTTPVASPSNTVRVPFKKTGGKFDPTVTVQLSWDLLDGSDNVIQSGTLDSDAFTSNCAV